MDVPLPCRRNRKGMLELAALSKKMEGYCEQELRCLCRLCACADNPALLPSASPCCHAWASHNTTQQVCPWVCLRLTADLARMLSYQGAEFELHHIQLPEAFRWACCLVVLQAWQPVNAAPCVPRSARLLTAPCA